MDLTLHPDRRAELQRFAVQAQSIPLTAADTASPKNPGGPPKRLKMIRVPLHGVLGVD
jgi:hypothetical protein